MNGPLCPHSRAAYRHFIDLSWRATHEQLNRAAADAAVFYRRVIPFRRIYRRRVQSPAIWTLNFHFLDHGDTLNPSAIPRNQKFFRLAAKGR